MLQEAATLVNILQWRARHQPYRRAFTFLTDGELREVHLTYEKIDQQARCIGALLQETEATGKRALLLYPPGLDFIVAFFGCLYAGVIAVPAYPPHPARFDRTLPRLQAILNDAKPAVVLTVSSILALEEIVRAQNPKVGPLRWLATDQDLDRLADRWHAPTHTREGTAFLQYTSGSTAAPKGVILTHGNLMHNSALIQRTFALTSSSHTMLWLPPYHDMGLIGGILQPIYTGYPAAFMSPAAFLQTPLAWLESISRYRASVSGGPNFAYELCVRKITDAQRKTLDLSSWKIAFNGAEPIRPETLKRFAAAFGPCGFRQEAFFPCYGLAEATLIVSGGRTGANPLVETIEQASLSRNRVVESAPGQPDSIDVASCGGTLHGQSIVIAHPEMLSRCLPDQIGEIWVSGPSVAQGYWHQPAETERTFNAYLADTGEGPFLRTGDLGFLHDGELFVTGRLKDLIIIDGRNHYPQDIEQTVEHSHPALRPGCCSAFAADIDGEERLVVVAEVVRGSTAEPSAVIKAIRRATAESHGLQVYRAVLLKTGGIPKTSSGKLQRHACREGFLAGTLDVWGTK